MMQKANLKKQLIGLPETKRNKIISELDDRIALELLYDWDFWARDKQLPPDTDWYVWLMLAGRGFGKTRAGAEQVRRWVNQGVKRMALVAETPGDARDVMIEGEAGLLNIYPPNEGPNYEPSKRRLTWPNGATATVYSGANPDQLRGPEHEKAWCDELAAWDYPQQTWDNLQMGLRLGSNPQVVVTTTPRPIPLIKGLVNQNNVEVVQGSTYENRANLPKTFFEKIINRYEGTRVGKQELYAELLTDNPGALWTYDLFRYKEDGPDLNRIVVAIDPAVTSNSESDETGIIVAGKDKAGLAYILDDFTCRKSPNEWTQIAIRAYDKYDADAIVAEVNQGGDMVESIMRSQVKNISYKQVRATRGKEIRAQPVSMLYEQGKVYHKKNFKVLEDQLCSWSPEDKDSPDRLDALVWALTDLMLKNKFELLI